MNKAELIEAISKKVSSVKRTSVVSDISKRSIGEVVEAFTSTVETTLKKGGRVALIGFGTFSTRKRAARVGRNPRTGEAIKVLASKVVKFSAGTGLKKAVNKK